MAVLGNVLLVAGLLSTAISGGLYFRSARRDGATLRLPALFLAASALCVVLASALLLFLILTHDFSVGYVYSYSDTSLPLHYLVSTFYAGQEGSFLFWALCAAVIGLLLRRRVARRGIEAPVMSVFAALELFLFILIVVRSPFRTVWEMFPGAPLTTPPDGRGLNPLLQNFWMVIHPPVLFLGFAAMSVPFALAVAGLWKKKSDMLSAHAFPWLLFAVGVLGLGIMLGAYWAYGVLGWGGYWGWDPVENSSLVPWLTGVALLHTLIAQRRTGSYTRTNFALAIASFVLVVYSTFLTRSGVLGDASVHAFTDPGAAIYWLLLAGLTLAAAAGGALLLLRARAFRPGEKRSGLLTRETSLGGGMLALVLSAAVVLFGTSLPILSRTRVEPSFYDATNMPIAVLMALLIGYALFMQWEVQDALFTLRRSLTSLGIAAIVSLLLLIAGVRDGAATCLIFAAVFALVVNVRFGAATSRTDWRSLGGKIAHAGVALFLIGVVATGRFGAKEHAVLPQYSPRTVLGRSMTYLGYTEQPGGRLDFAVSVTGPRESFRLVPSMAPGGEQGVLRTPDIASFLTEDVYISPVGVQEPEATPASTGAAPEPQALVADVSTKPYINFLWGGTLVMMAGFALACVKRSKEA
ncbi:MAG TPA: cytochrome c biogenesis protein CcsA [Bacteroidota bacterium]|nr:cytochrome c biogenesis protein CcsA [Bacteroidota bacterium]